MAHGDAITRGHRASEPRQFRGAGVHAGHVFQARGHAEGACIEVRAEQFAHPRDAGGVGVAPVIGDAGLPAQRAVAGKRRHVDVRPCALDRVEPATQSAGSGAGRAAAVLAQHHGGHAHGEEAGVRGFQRISMHVQVDEARCQYPAAAVDHPCAAWRARPGTTDVRDASVLHQHIGGMCRRAGAVDQPHIAQQQCLRRRRMQGWQQRARARRTECGQQLAT